jgi:hypothetical protein
MPKDQTDDLIESLLDSDDETDDDVTTKTLKEELAALKKENHGLLTTVKKERSKRQNSDGKLEQLSGQYNHLSDTVNGILEQKRTGAADPTPAAGTEGPQVLYNDDGDPYLPTEAVNSLITPLQQEIDELKQALQITTTQSAAQAEAERAKAAVIGKDEAYGPAHAKYQTARNWVEKVVENWQYQTGNQGQQVGSGYALDTIFDADLREQFSTEFPDMDLFTIVTAEDGLDHFERTLQSLVVKEEELVPTKKLDSRFRQVLNKPSTLGKTANAKAEPTIVEKAGNLSASDIGSLTDAQVAALEKAMLAEENEGIDF